MFQTPSYGLSVEQANQSPCLQGAHSLVGETDNEQKCRSHNISKWYVLWRQVKSGKEIQREGVGEGTILDIADLVTQFLKLTLRTSTEWNVLWGLWGVCCISGEAVYECAKNMAPQVRQTCIRIYWYCHLLAVWPLASYIPSLCFRFLICRKKIMIVPAS